MQRPIEQCYWVEPGRLLGGEYPGTRDSSLTQAKIDRFLRVGVGAFIDLTEEDEGLSPYADLIGKARHLRFPIRDVSTPDSPEDMVLILDAVDKLLDQGVMTYVHCWGGVGRTGTVIGCWLARRIGGEAALERLQALWRECPKSAHRDSPETDSQRAFVKAWGRGA